MTSEQALLKSQLRREIRARMAGVTVEQRTAGSEKLCALMVSHSIWETSRKVLLYSPLRDEVDISPLLVQALASGKCVALPRFMPESGFYEIFQVKDASADCARGKFGILEPGPGCPALALNHLDLVLAPGVGFDATGHRLGRGGGYYDRLLSRVSGVKCGVLFDEQLVRQYPAEPHDIQMDILLTPTRWLEKAGTPQVLK